MEDYNRNTRTLIVSFVVALFALIPLRFVEYGNQSIMMAQSSNSTYVLGDTDVMYEPEEFYSEEAEVVLQAPYDEIEAMGEVEGVSEEYQESEVAYCMPLEVAQERVDEIQMALETADESVAQSLFEELNNLVEMTCTE